MNEASVPRDLHNFALIISHFWEVSFMKISMRVTIINREDLLAALIQAAAFIYSGPIDRVRLPMNPMQLFLHSKRSAKYGNEAFGICCKETNRNGRKIE